METVRGLARLWPLHLAVLVIGVVSQLIGILRIPIGIGTILLLPMLFAFALALLLNPNIVPAVSRIMPVRRVAAASPLIVVAIMPFIARFGADIGPGIELVIRSGPALLLQEIGNLGTIVLAFPIAVWVLRMGRESIGAVHSIAREPNIAIVADRYGLRSAEGTGVLGVYVMGTLFGTFIFAIIASLLDGLGVFSLEALAMACGVGSGSMMAACSGALAAANPADTESITALAGSSNLLTYATGMYVSLFVALPLVEWMYRRSRPDDPLNHVSSTARTQGEAA
ncbi:DUF3100 domain-containing protein [Brachybacterium sp. J144]|uniref:DUF3100 domain-containing protein n=1 Tax=Brachybacterium sp. J144 TaxID=3116487 RepID=UPI002E764B14|nr:DUF3100 domain-containing protein [Brachybacterium sp. J144]MEE1650319.1 DUF3100 domain-containing protein [Brachybacterium sp. J144]